MAQKTSDSPDTDVIVVGAGFAGMYALHKFRGLGLRTQVLEAGNDVGGTWYWNRYPGARCDVPSVEYSYSFDKDLEQAWDWTEIMAAQPEILEYANHVADRFDLRKGIQFQTRVDSAVFDENSNRWTVVTDSGQTYTAQFCVMATGCLSVPNTPRIDGQDNFAGSVYHTGNWPEGGVDFSGAAVGIIGTGSSGIQSIPVIAEQAKHLTVFQRTPNYTMPAANAPLKAEFLRQAKENYAAIRAEQRASQVGIVGYGFGFGGAENVVPTQEIKQTTPAERQRLVEEEGFLAIRRYADVALDEEANELACEMYRDQVERVIKDPATAQALMPRDYPMGCKRPVIDTNYYETFNRDNVTLVDLRQGGIEEITEAGVRTAQGDYAFDVLVYATGFDAMTGALGKIDIRGRENRALTEYWEAGPRTYLGLQIAGFPNLFTVTGPGSPSVLSNMIVSIEQHIDWIARCISDLDQRGAQTIEATTEAEDEWIAHVNDVAQNTMFTAKSCNSWYLGANIPGKPRIFMPYVGGVGVYREKCDEVARNGYQGFELSA
ncbi:MAG: cyclohexanone monooxygenase [Gammaproteobacteria bacterium]|nr:cyclohexanone monooxygenase [Gammaproteobacteria bacterium]